MQKEFETILVQFNPTVGDVNGNAARIINYINKYKSGKLKKLIIFPELSLCGYSPEDILLRDDFANEISKNLNKISGHVDSSTYVILGAPHYSSNNKKIWNSAYVINKNKVIGIYDKQILPNYGVFDEKRYFNKGEKNYCFNINNIKVGLYICEDIWNIDSSGNLIENDQIDLLVCINASPFEIKKDKYREMLLKKISTDSKVDIIYLNTVGGQDEIVFDGSSIIMNKNGEILYKLKSFYEEDYKFTFNSEKNEKSLFEYSNKETSKKLYKDMYNALKLGTYDYIKKNNLDGILVGLSGGIDSALTLVIACDVFGPNKVEAILLPSKYTSDLSNELAIKLCKNLKVKYSIVPIEDIDNIINLSLENIFDGLSKDITEENIQARIRGLILMAISNKSGKVVLATGNKSEMAVGYSTLYGDMSGSFAPLKDVYKTDVYNLANYRNSISKVIPEAIIEREPTAELSPNQKDTDSLPKYEDLDSILKEFIEKKKSSEEIQKLGYDKLLVDKTISMVVESEYKRRQSVPGVKIYGQSFGKDRRYPIVSQFKF
ncbi:MAG: NAD+ synthase [Gammaproteobacteria bacterium]|nr:NAD+ synthase [Gammaproteobacteria bacterium]